ncbi:sigma-70 family RNA polymerase sigma factor [Benzoatithermus flavus]|uniref:Sigma-70 family RNA polymerase sigma factor n=1 Tax=Benzoatithermus flavus TaxID=3108223 RepID=A0ABU8XPB6_9PROT
MLRDRADEAFDEAALASWVADVAHRNTDALALLYGRTSSRLLAVLIRLLRRRDLAEEILHDVYVRVWDRADAYDPVKGPVMAWLIGIARNAALDHLRRQRREVAFADGPEQVELPDLADLARASTARLALQACLERLEPEPRRCVILAYRDGLTYDDLARRLDRPVNTIKSWIRRSLARLRACLEAE